MTNPITKYFEHLLGNLDNRRGVVINVVNSPNARVDTQFIEHISNPERPGNYIPWTALNPMEVENHHIPSRQWQLESPAIERGGKGRNE
jgi:hypothetical protein